MQDSQADLGLELLCSFSYSGEPPVAVLGNRHASPMLHAAECGRHSPCSFSRTVTITGNGDATMQLNLTDSFFQVTAHGSSTCS